MQGGDVLQVAGGDEGGDRVAQHGQHHLAQRAGVAAGQVGCGEDGDAGEAEDEAGDAPGAEVFGGAEEPGQGDADDRDARDQQARRGAGEMALGVGEGPPGADDLDAREGQHRLPARPDGPRQARLP
nr:MULTISPECIES: hypothetical protein [Streptomyces]